VSQLNRAANEWSRLTRQCRLALSRGTPISSSRLAACDSARRCKKGCTLIAYETQAIGELLGQLARGAPHALLDLLDCIDGAVGLLRQRRLSQVPRLAQLAIHDLSIPGVAVFALKPKYTRLPGEFGPCCPPFCPRCPLTRRWRAWFTTFTNSGPS
jgi:hypothetical protein